MWDKIVVGSGDIYLPFPVGTAVPQLVVPSMFILTIPKLPEYSCAIINELSE